jgi:hypothetical protein
MIVDLEKTISSKDSPSARPSPAGRGRIVRRIKRNRESVVSPRLFEKPKTAESCSLSHRMGEGQGEGKMLFNIC